MKTIVLLSGGIDSTVALATLLQSGHECLCLSFDYHIRHKAELKSAAAITRHYKVPHIIVNITDNNLSPLTAATATISDDSHDDISDHAFFVTYAMGYAARYNAEAIALGTSHCSNISHPQCKPEFFEHLQALLNFTTTHGTQEKNRLQLLMPLLSTMKNDIIRKGLGLKVPLHLTFTCRTPLNDMYPCQKCWSCRTRNDAYHSLLYQGQKQQLRRSKPAERENTPDSSVNIHPLVVKFH